MVEAEYQVPLCLVSLSQSYVLSLFWVVVFWSLNQFMVILCI